QNCGLYGAASNAQLPSTSGQSNTEKRTSMNICSECFKKIGKGVRHSCGAGPSSSSAREIVLSLVEKLPEKQLNQQTATATYPCPYCFITLSELHTFGKLTGDADKEESMEIDVDDIILKTFKNLKDDYNKFKCFGKDKKYAKECHSAKCVLPELHLLQGFTNHLFWNGIVPAVGREKALLWPSKLKLVAKNYQCEIFEGNACQKLLQESDKLLDPYLRWSF
ncbi:hypothetical protein CBL_20877, partial [Carabus blaptoides fortunei]